MQARSGPFFNTLSGRFLLLTVVFVMLAEVLIFVPSIARFQRDYLQLRLEKAQIAALSVLASDNMIMPELETELLANAEVFNVVLRRDEIRQLVLSSPVPAEIEQTIDLRMSMPWPLIRGAFHTLFHPDNRVIRVIGNPVREAGLLIEITMETNALRLAMLDYGLRILALSALISVVTAFLLFLAVRRLLVLPIRRVVRQIDAYAQAPEDARRLITPSASVAELRTAEDALHSLQTQLTGALRQKERLAQLGGAVAKISHDLRNVLTTAQLFADRMEGSSDPIVAKSAPKLVKSISRAVSLCESTLTFGKADDSAPILQRFQLLGVVNDVLEGEGLGVDGSVTALVDIAPGYILRADPEQLFRVLTNLARNAKQAIEATGTSGTIEVSATEDDTGWQIRVGDTGPGLPPRARDHLFTAFQGGVRKGGTGLGLVISAELVRGHGGSLDLVRSDKDGTEFVIRLPKEIAGADQA